MARFSATGFVVSLVITIAAGVGGVIAYRELTKPPSPIPDLTGLKPIKVACVDLTDKVRGREAVAELFELADRRRVARITLLGNAYLYTIYDTAQAEPVRYVDLAGEGEFQPLTDSGDPPVPDWVVAGAEALRGQRIEEHCMVKHGDGG